MHCLLVAATSFEIGPFMDYYNNSAKKLHIDFTIDLLITGVGSTATAYSLTRQLQTKKYDVVIQAGIAGCYDLQIPLGSVMAIQSESFGDLGVFNNKDQKDLFDLKLASPNTAPFQQKKLKNPHKIWLKRTRLKSVTGVTVNNITTGKKNVAGMKEKFNAVSETMEGAAFHYVCIMEKIPFVQVRSFSNYAGERNKKQWKLSLAVSHLNNELIRLFSSL